MSRSYRKPFITDQQKGKTRWPKRRANRSIRDLTFDDTPQNGKAYRKESNSYDIRDFSFFAPESRKARNK